MIGIRGEVGEFCRHSRSWHGQLAVTIYPLRFVVKLKRTGQIHIHRSTAAPHTMPAAKFSKWTYLLGKVDIWVTRLSLGGMDVQLPPEQEAQLGALAAEGGRAPDDLAREVFGRALAEEARFVAAVKQGLASLDRGKYPPPCSSRGAGARASAARSGAAPRRRRRPSRLPR